MSQTVYFPYTQQDVAYLKSVDKKLAEVIDLIGPLQRKIEPDLFSSLVTNIVGQQISIKAQDTIWNRMLTRFGRITPAAFCSVTQEEIQSFGITMKKAQYIKEISHLVQEGKFNLEQLYACDDDEVCRRLSALPGIGVWTAEMLMLFSMARPNIFSYGDLAMHRGLRMIYHHRKIDKDLFEKYRRRFSPCCTLASFYIWDIAMNKHGYRDYAPAKKK